VNQLRLCIRLLECQDPGVNTDLMEGLRSLSVLPAHVQQSLAERISVGMLTLLRANWMNLHSREDWKTVISQLQEFAGMPPASSRPALEALSFCINEERAVSALNFDFCLQTLVCFLDSTLDAGVAKQHACVAYRTQTPSPGDIRKWQVQTSRGIMGMMYSLFMRLAAWRAEEHKKNARAPFYAPANLPQQGTPNTVAVTPATAQANNVAVNKTASVSDKGDVESASVATRKASVDVNEADSNAWSFGLGGTGEDEQNW
jgi:hypothetical protein